MRGALLCALCGAASAQTVSQSVTISGLAPTASVSLELSPTWQVATVSDALVVSNGACPPGAFCPAGASAPAVCPTGSWCPAGASAPFACAPGAYNGASAPADCGGQCPANYYCPDPGAKYPCPVHTYSLAGTPSQLGCLCASGYSCSYLGNMQVTLQLAVSLSTWLGDAGLRNQTLAAVAAAAGVGADSVQVASVKPIAPAGRRLLSLAGSMQENADAEPRLRSLASPADAEPRLRSLVGQRPGLSVVLLVRGAESFERLDAHLAAAHRALRGARAEWRHGSRVRVLHRPADAP